MNDLVPVSQAVLWHSFHFNLFILVLFVLYHLFFNSLTQLMIFVLFIPPLFHTGPSVQLGRWDPQGPSCRAEAVLLRQEQPGPKLQEPGPLCHHKISLPCKFKKKQKTLFYFFILFLSQNIFFIYLKGFIIMNYLKY